MCAQSARHKVVEIVNFSTNPISSHFRLGDRGYPPPPTPLTFGVPDTIWKKPSPHFLTLRNCAERLILTLYKTIDILHLLISLSHVVRDIEILTFDYREKAALPSKSKANRDSMI